MAPRKAFALRIDPAVFSQVEKLAASELRSVNSQLEILLREAIERRNKREAKPK